METELIVRYTKQIYSYEDIIKAVNDVGICSVSVSESQEDFVCRFELPKGADPIILYEFSNYLIELNGVDR